MKRKVSKVHPNIMKTNRLLIGLRQEKSTGIVNPAITPELPQLKRKICRNLGISVLGFIG